ncbi:MAG: hypothetical protein PHQ81_07400, partial [Methanofollis sp.]|nr:hypothetical protein [Methanofollis sp.]
MRRRVFTDDLKKFEKIGLEKSSPFLSLGSVEILLVNLSGGELAAPRNPCHMIGRGRQHLCHGRPFYLLALIVLLRVRGREGRQRMHGCAMKNR